MKRLNKKGFTLVELLAVIVVLAIVMGLAVVAITGVLDNARKATFVADAKQFLEGARNIINAEDMNAMLGEDSGHRVECGGDKTSDTIPIGDIKLSQGGKKSPYGNSYDSNSKIYVSASGSGSDCIISYAIYLSDGVYAIGSDSAQGAADWDSLTAESVQPITNANNG